MINLVSFCLNLKETGFVIGIDKGNPVCGRLFGLVLLRCIHVQLFLMDITLQNIKKTDRFLLAIWV